MTQSVSLRGLDELAVTLPYQFGYRLEQCVVALALRAGRVQSAARIPLGRADLDPLFAAWLREEPDDLVLIGYCEVLADAHPLMSALRSVAIARGLPEPMGLTVVGSVMYPPPWIGDGEGAGSELPEPHRVPALTGLIVGGAAPLRSREQVAALVEPGRDATATASLLESLPTPTVDDAAGAWAALLREPEGTWRGIEIRQAAVAIASLTEIGFRDALVQRIVDLELARADLHPESVRALRVALPATLPPPNAALIDRLSWLAQATPAGRWAAPVLTVAALSAWGAGNGTLARCAIDRALREAPNYRLATLVSLALERGLQPPAVSRRG